MTADRELVTRKIALILEDVRALGAYAAKPLDAYLSSDTDELVVERYLERIIGRMIDINYHLLATSDAGVPRDYHDSFVRLASIGVLPHDFATRIASCAGLRNRIVHEYDVIDPQQVHAALGAAVRDVPAYLRHVEAYLKPRSER